MTGQVIDSNPAAAGIREDKDAPLVQSLKGRTGQLTGRRPAPDNILG